MTSGHIVVTHPRRTAPRYARQALRLCEAELLPQPWDTGDSCQGTPYLRPPPPRANAVRAALLAVGLPQRVAVALRRRLQLIPEEEDRT